MSSKSNIMRSENRKQLYEQFPKLKRYLRIVSFMSFFKICWQHPNKCWAWQGSKDNDGYGQFPAKSTLGSRKAHVVSYLLFKGGIPKHHGKKQLCVLHTCDNPTCVNPLHLWLGTRKDNNRDAIKKGRRVNFPVNYGENNGKSVLTWKEVHDIRRLYKTGKYTCKDLQHKFNTKADIPRIINNSTWKEENRLK